MLGLLKKQLIKSAQNRINRRYPSVKIILHKEMPQPSVRKMSELAAQVEKVNLFEEKLMRLTDKELQDKTLYFKEKIREKEKLVKPQIDEVREEIAACTLDEEKARLREKLKVLTNSIFSEILPEAFAVVREASRRTIGLRHFDVQIAGGIVLHEGKIAEMATGEGKTLVATLPAYLNALLERGVHIVTVNDYLARRDREWMGPIYEFLGLSVGVIQHDMSDEERKQAYSCDITYGTNNEFGFDYLRDNMKYSLQDVVQRDFFYAIVDEVDSILIDEARTPLIISGPAEESTEKYYIVDRIIPQLKGRKILESDEIEAKYKGTDLAKGYDYIVNEKTHTVYLTEEGEGKVCKMLGIDNMHDFETIHWRHHVIQALRAHNLYRRDVDYVVKDGQVIIVDEFTGRLMPGRRWSDGLHQAVEAKEGLRIERENQTLATITFQNYFRMYEKLAGMTGTAFTEAAEFKAIYGLEVVVIPTNKPLIRTNYPDCVYKTQAEKFSAVVEEICQHYEKGRPVLVGTISIEKSEQLSQMLKKRGIPHQVLNAKYHEMEAQIIAQAGRLKSVTIATNMAGRGTDILLGGNPEFLAKAIARQRLQPDDPQYQQKYEEILRQMKEETKRQHQQVVALGGLHVIGTERHEARRIDNQLRGRCGRQGDPGSSRFYVSLEDDLMRLFGSDRIKAIMDRLGLEDGEVIEHPWVTKSIEIAQRRVEQHNFEIRKQLLDYDNVMNKQREIIYSQRRQLLEGASFQTEIEEIIHRIATEMVNASLLNDRTLDIAGLVSSVQGRFGVVIEGLSANQDAREVSDFLAEVLLNEYKRRKEQIGEEAFGQLERLVFLQTIDSKWKDHLRAMDDLREGIGLRAYAQRDPLVEYRQEAYTMFMQMIKSIEEEVIETVFKLKPAASSVKTKMVFLPQRQELLHPQLDNLASSPLIPTERQAPVSGTRPLSSKHSKVGRNDPCPCGSGKKYKKCCGR